MNRQSHPSQGLSAVSLIQSTTRAVNVADQMASTENLSLIASLHRGDEDAFMSLLQRYHSSMVRLALIYIPGYKEAELLVEEAWMAILQNLEQLQPDASLKIEIHRILITSARSRRHQLEGSQPSARFSETSHARDVDSWRFFQGDHPLSGSWSVPPRSWNVLLEPRLPQDTRAIIEEAIERLPLDQREVITLRDVEGWFSSEVSALLGLSENHQRTLLHRARTLVRGVLEKYFEEE